MDPDPDTHQLGIKDQDPHQIDNLDPDPDLHRSADDKPKCMKYE
jgi:hypothetical protein